MPKEDCPQSLLQYVNKPKEFRVHVCKELIIMNNDIKWIKKINWVIFGSIITVFFVIMSIAIKTFFF